MLVFFVIFASVDFLVGFILKKMTDETVKGDIGRNNYIMKDLSNRDILIFGSSRAIHHYNPTLIGDSLKMSCYNCGEDGMGIILSYSRLKAILTRHTPKVIIYDIEPTYDLYENDNERYLGKLKFFYPNYGTKIVFDDISTTEKFKMHSLLYRYNSQLIDILIQRLSSSPVTGQDYTYSPIKKTMDYEPIISHINNKQIDTLKMKYLNSFIRVCKYNNISLFFVLSPKYRNYTELRFFIDLCKNNNVPLLNHFTDSYFNMNKKYFSDQTHLNEDGAILFSKTICDEIKKYK